MKSAAVTMRMMGLLLRRGVEGRVSFAEKTESSDGEKLERTLATLLVDDV